MKRLLRTLFTVAALASFVACDDYVVQYQWNKGGKQEDPDPKPEETITKTFSASLEDSTFQAADEIEIFWGKSALQKTSAIPDAGSNPVTFTTPVGKADNYFAAFPSGVASYPGDNTMKFTIDVNQNGDKARSLLYAATTTFDDAALNFKAINAAVKFTLTRDDIALISVRAQNGAQIAGSGLVAFNAGTPEFLFDEGKTEIRVAPAESEVFTEGDYFMSIAALGNLTDGLSFSFKNADGVTLGNPYVVAPVNLGRNALADVGEIDKQIGELEPDLFVTLTGAGKKNGKNWENAMGQAEFKALLEYNSTTAASNAAKIDNKIFRLAAGSYSIADEINKYCNVSFAEYGTTVTFGIFGGYDPSSTEKDVTKRNVKSFETLFSGNNANAVLSVGPGVTLTIDGMVFEKSKGIAAVALESGSFEPRALTIYDGSTTVNVNNCIFRDNVENVNKGGAAILVSKGKCYVNNSIFIRNQSKSQGGAIRVDGTNAYIFANNCKFNDNKLNDNATYGSVMFVRGNCCFNKCTFYGNNEQEGVNQPTINTNYNYIFSNNIIFGKSAFGTGTGLIRSETQSSNGYVGYFINNILVNTYTGANNTAWAILASKTEPTSGGYNVFIGQNNGISHSDRFPIVATDVDATSLSNTYSFDPTTLEVTINGTIQGHDTPTKAVVEAGIKSVTPTAGEANLGEMFVDWLKTLNEL